MVDDFLITTDLVAGKKDCNSAVVSIYPNPVVASFNIELSSKFHSNNVLVTFTDILGKTVMTFNKTSLLNISSLSKAVYMNHLFNKNNLPL